MPEERSGLAEPKNTSPAIDVVNIIQLNIDKQTFSLASALSQSYRSSLPLITHSFAAMFQRGGARGAILHKPRLECGSF